VAVCPPRLKVVSHVPRRPACPELVETIDEEAFEVDYSFFAANMFPKLAVSSEAATYPASLIWTEIMTHIKGRGGDRCALLARTVEHPRTLSSSFCVAAKKAWGRKPLPSIVPSRRPAGGVSPQPCAGEIARSPDLVAYLRMHVARGGSRLSRGT